MADHPSAQLQNTRSLRFACSCASAVPADADPWVAIAKQGKLADGTKELILNALHRRPRSGIQLAWELDLSPPAVHRHLAELLASELIREEPIPPDERRSPAERRYRPNFPIVLAGDRRALEPVLGQLADAIAEVFRLGQSALAEAFAGTNLASEDEPFEEFLHYLYAASVRLARERLEAEGLLPDWPEHRDGSRWVWWAEEPPETEVE
jgi:DNA-binding transcriptional ArsR family regulator